MRCGKSNFMRRKDREAMLVSARLMFGIVSGLWSSKGTTIIEPHLDDKTSNSLERLSVVVQEADKIALFTALNFKNATKRSLGQETSRDSIHLDASIDEWVDVQK